MVRTVVALGLLALSSGASASAWEVIPRARMFPPGEGAPETLDRPLPALLQAWQRRTGKRTFQRRIVVHKAKRRMDVFADGDVVKSYVVELGLAPVGDKQALGDRRTPEGDLFICAVNRASQYTRFLGLAYPTPAAAAAGVAGGRVKPAVERAVKEAHRTRDRCPPQGTALGGAVGIHGKAEWERRPEGIAVVDWTWGCVALRDEDVVELFEHYAAVGVPVRIEAE
jgi:murein L,D-transpeptidase YafK